VSIFGVTGNFEGSGGGSGGGESSSRTISVYVNNSSPEPVYYWDETKIKRQVPPNSASTVKALSGFLYCSVSANPMFSGDYVNDVMNIVVMTIFLSDGGSIHCTASGGGGGAD
jgi:hypothetical protein